MCRLLCVVFPLGICALNTGCWDEITHVYDCECDENPTDSTEPGDTESAGDGDSDSAELDTSGQGIRPEGWERFGGRCTEDSECTGYPRSRCIDTNILRLINVPGGYCTACCDLAGEYCAEGVQCIGLDDVYLICAASCVADSDCRTQAGYVCRTIPPYLDTSLFPGKFCLPDDDHISPPADAIATDPHCDWPWL